MRIVFYGTPEFAVASLESIISHGFNVVAVVSSPDKPAGRGMHLQQSAVKQCALKHGLPVLQPVNLKSPEFLEQLKQFNPDIQVIIAFRMLPEIVWNFPKLGTMNLHASLLPNYRGAAPINRAIMNGETETGVTTFFLKHAIDTGDIILQEKVEITSKEDAGTLHDKLMIIGAGLVVKTLEMIEKGDYTEYPQVVQPNHQIAPKIFTADCEINWNKRLNVVSNQIRGLSPYPGAFTKYQEKTLKIYKGSFELCEVEQSGLFELSADRRFRISGIDGWYYPEIVQPEGKRKMQIQDFVNGLKIDL